MSRTWNSEYFYGNKISDEGLRRGYVDYLTLSRAFDAVLNNNIFNAIGDITWELENGNDYDEENERLREIFQYFIITGSGAEILKEWTDEIVYYNEDLDMYLWGVTHFGTAWDYVLTDIKIERREEA